MRILGLDLGTNSIGWAIRDTEYQDEELRDYGVVIFTKGVGDSKSGEFSRAAERTTARNLRKQYDRRRRRKAKLLSALQENEMCPISKGEIYKWQEFKDVPRSKEYLAWQRLNPYESRDRASREKVDKYIFGRALYHLCQRRGFLSNRKSGNSSEDGKVKSAIAEIATKKETLTYGQYFKSLDPHKQRIRGNYTSRHEYKDEFEIICEMQGIEENLQSQLYNIIYDQRDLKSQKGAIGRCRYEKNKKRSAKSHPAIEMYTSLAFLSNIRITIGEEKQRLDTNDIQNLLPIFSDTKASFNFLKISKVLRKKYGSDIELNYNDKEKISNAPSIYYLRKYLGDDWESVEINGISHVDVWHACKDFRDEAYLRDWAQNKLDLNEKEANEFAKVKVSEVTSNLSVKAAKKISRFLLLGYSLAESTFMAKIPELIGEDTWTHASERILDAINVGYGDMADYNMTAKIVKDALRFRTDEMDFNDDTPLDEALLKGFIKKRMKFYKVDDNDKSAMVANSISEFRKYEILRRSFKTPCYLTQYQVIKDYIRMAYKIEDKKLDTIYHPSMITDYEKVETKLESPLTSSIKNPVVMRMMHLLRNLVNTLIEKGKVDKDTTVLIEVAKELNTSNKRKAIQDWQKENEKRNALYRKEIEKYANEHNQSLPPDRIPILIRKMRLWEEQGKICLYTGKSIPLGDLLSGDNFDIEHTIPRSISFDTELRNLTIADRAFNSKIKLNKIPTELSENMLTEIYARIELQIKPKLEQAKNRYLIAKSRMKGIFSTKEARDQAMVQKHLREMEFRYWKSKIGRFYVKDLEDGFKPSQIRDTQIFTKYSIAYLNSYFNRPVRGNKASVIDQISKIWGIKEVGQAKDRSRHYHHAVDAAVLCYSYGSIKGKSIYDKLSEYYAEQEFYKGTKGRRPKFDWISTNQIVPQINAIKTNTTIYHHSNDNTFKQTNKKERKAGIIQRKSDGSPIMKKGVGVRASLHKETYYRAVGDIDNPTYRSRKMVDGLKESDIKNICDDKTRELIKSVGLDQIKEEGLYRKVKSIKLKNGQKKAISAFHSVDQFRTEVDDSNHWKQTILDQLKRTSTTFQNIEVQQEIKKVLVNTPDVKTPVVVRSNAYKSDHPLRNQTYAKNDVNYCLVLYKGENEKVNPLRSYELINAMDAAQSFRTEGINHLVPITKVVQKKKEEYQLEMDAIYQTGQLVLLLNNNADLPRWNNQKDLAARLYVIKSLTHMSHTYGVVQVVHSSISDLTGLKVKGEEYDKGGDTQPYLKFLHTKFNALQNGVDFMISIDGEIRKK